MAKAVSVSAPTISRFARELGVSGFAEMRSEVAKATQATMDPVAKLRSKLRSDWTEGRAGETFVAIRQQIQMIDPDQINELAQRLARRIRNARNVYVMGFGTSELIAGLLSMRLRPFHPGVVNVAEAGGTEVAARNLIRIEAPDLLIAITFPRYGRDPVQLTQYAHDRGAQIAVITDSAASPLCPLADELAFIPAEHPVLTSSVVAAVAFVETVLSAVMLSDAANVENAGRLHAAVATYLFSNQD